MASFSGIPIEVQFVCGKIAISGQVYNQPTAILTYKDREQRLDLTLELTDDRWSDSKIAAVAIMRDAVINRKTLEVDFDENTMTVLTVRLVS